jgi:hypothetical protein
MELKRTEIMAKTTHADRYVFCEEVETHMQWKEWWQFVQLKWTLLPRKARMFSVNTTS